MAERIREDVESAYLSVEQFVGQTLVNPRDIISRKIPCSNTQVLATENDAGAAGTNVAKSQKSNSLTNLSFRVLSTSPGAMLNSKVVLTVPLLLHHVVGHNAKADTGQFQNYTYAVAGADTGDAKGWCDTGFAGQYAPRRNGLLKALRSITSTINSSVSFSNRPSENIAVFEQIFDQPGGTGVYVNQADYRTGNTDGCLRALSADAGGNPGANTGAAAAGARVVVDGENVPQGDILRTAQIFYPTESEFCRGPVNDSFIERRADLRSGGGASKGGIKTDANTFNYASGAAGTYIKYDLKTTLMIPPLSCFSKDLYCRSPTFIPYCDSLDLMLAFKSSPEVKAAILQCASMREGGNEFMIQDYDVSMYANPYLTVEFCVPPVSLRPSYTLPVWRSNCYTQTLEWEHGDDAAKPVSFSGIRLDSFPSLVSIHVEDDDSYKRMDVDSLVWRSRYYNWRETFGKIDGFSCTLNEKMSILSDKSSISSYELFKLYQMYAPDSKMDYTTWREMRQVILLRSDCLALEHSQHTFSPTNISFDFSVRKAQQHNNVTLAVPQPTKMTVKLNFYYFADSLSLSQQAAAVTSMLLSPAETRQVRVSPESREATSLMEMKLTS